MADGTAKRMMYERQPERIVSGQAFDEDARIEVSVRPRRLEDYIGQKRVKENIQIAIDAGAQPRRGAGPRATVRTAGGWAKPRWRK